MIAPDSPASEPDDVCIGRCIPMEPTDGKNLSFMMKLVRRNMGKELKHRDIHFDTVLTSPTVYHLAP